MGHLSARTLVAALCLALLAGCGTRPAAPAQQSGSSQGTAPGSAPREQAAPQASQEPFRATFTLGGTNGGFYRVGAPIAEYINKSSKFLTLTPSTSGGSVENIRRVASKQAQFGGATNDVVASAWLGQQPFTEALKDVRVVGPSLQALSLHAVALKKSGITALEHLNGKKVVLGAPGSAAEIWSKKVLAAAGVNVNPSNADWAEVNTLLRDGVIHAYMALGNIPLDRVTEATTFGDVVVLDIGAVLQRTDVLKQNPMAIPVTIPKGTYKGQDQNLTTLGVGSVWLVHKDVPEHVVYEFARLAYSSDMVALLDKSYSAHGHNLKDPLAGLLIPLHPGAEKFWKERGVNIPKPSLQ